MELSRLRAENAQLKMEMEILKKPPHTFCEGVGVYAFVEQHRDCYPLQARCEALQVSESGFAAWRQSEG